MPKNKVVCTGLLYLAFFGHEFHIIGIFGNFFVQICHFSKITLYFATDSDPDGTEFWKAVAFDHLFSLWTVVAFVRKDYLLCNYVWHSLIFNLISIGGGFYYGSMANKYFGTIIFIVVETQIQIKIINIQLSKIIKYFHV